MDANYNIYDGAHVEQNCTDINKAQFSYNNAVYLIGAAHMYNHVSAGHFRRFNTLTAANSHLDRERCLEAACPGPLDRHDQRLLPQEYRIRGVLRRTHDLYDRHAELQGLRPPVVGPDRPTRPLHPRPNYGYSETISTGSDCPMHRRKHGAAVRFPVVLGELRRQCRRGSANGRSGSRHVAARRQRRLCACDEHHGRYQCGEQQCGVFVRRLHGGDYAGHYWGQGWRVDPHGFDFVIRSDHLCLDVDGRVTQRMGFRFYFWFTDFHYHSWKIHRSRAVFGADITFWSGD